MVCAALGEGTPFLTGVLTHVDCQAQTIGQTGYAILSSPGSSVALMLGGVLTIFVALFGYRLLVGSAPDTRETVVAIVKLGVVLTLATSWPAFRTLAYDVVMWGPAELAIEIAAPTGLPGASGDPLAHLQFVDDALIELDARGGGSAMANDQPASVTVGPAVRSDAIEDGRALRQARTFYLASTIAAFASVRLVAGLLLALGPLFALFLLFDGTRGVFEGWIRALGGAALGAVSTGIVLGVQLAILEPWLAAIVSDRRQHIARPEVPIELLALNLVFGLVLLAAMIFVARVAYGFRLPTPWRRETSASSSITRSSKARLRLPGTASIPSAVPAEQRSRAATIADAVLLTQRREQNGGATNGGALEGARRAEPVGSAAQTPVTIAQTPLGQSNRRPRSRVSASAARRNTRS